MKTDIITIGDEILIGQIVDTNSAWMGKAITSAGGVVRSINTISDSKEAIKSQLKTSLENSDLVIMTGGLGPTKDDVTKECLAEFFGVDMVFHQEVLDNIIRLFKRPIEEINEANRSQAYLPSNCKPLQNVYGTAPGMMFEIEGKYLISMPGVPYEMKYIMEHHVLNLLSENRNTHYIHRTSVVANVPESVIAEQLRTFQEELPSSFKLAYLPHMNLVRLRVSAHGNDRDALEKEINSQQNKIRSILGEVVISDEDLGIEEIVGKELKARNKTLSVAESCTGGYVSHLITRISGSSSYYPGSVVTYSYDIKSSELNVPSEVLWQQGAVSEDVVCIMATNVRRKMNTDFGLALSGIAGPGGGTKDKPVGTVWLAVSSAEKTVAKCYQLRGDRIQNIERSAILGLEYLRKMIVGQI